MNKLKFDEKEIPAEQIFAAINRTALICFDAAAPYSLLDSNNTDETDSHLVLNQSAKHLRGRRWYLRLGMQSVLLLQSIEALCSEISGELVQSASDNFRMQSKLKSAQQTKEYFDDNGLNFDQWADCVEVALSLDNLKRNLFGDKIETWYAQNSRTLDNLELAKITVNDIGMSEEIIDQINEGDISFADAVERYEIDRSDQNRAGYWGIKSRSQVDHAAEARLFDANVGDLVGPVEVGENVHVFRVLNRFPAALNDSTSKKILNVLFVEWWQDQQYRIAL